MHGPICQVQGSIKKTGTVKKVFKMCLYLEQYVIFQGHKSDLTHTLKAAKINTTKWADGAIKLGFSCANERLYIYFIFAQIL